MTYNITEIRGIESLYVDRLAAAGIKDTDALLLYCGTPNGRRLIGEQSGLNVSQLEKWASMAELMRVPGVESQYVELLELAGVDTIAELRSRESVVLARRMKELNDKTRLARISPSAAMVHGWIEEAKTLESKFRT